MYTQINNEHLTNWGRDTQKDSLTCTSGLRVACSAKLATCLIIGAKLVGPHNSTVVSAWWYAWITPCTPRQYGLLGLPLRGNSKDTFPPIFPPKPRAGNNLSLYDGEGGGNQQFCSSYMYMYGFSMQRKLRYLYHVCTCRPLEASHVLQESRELLHPTSTHES